jgi:large subunit ribosomal protein L21
MYAVVDDSGRQFKLRPGEEVLMDHKDVAVGEPIEFDRVLMIGGEQEREPQVGQPLVPGASVLGRVMRHEKGPKVTTVRYKGPSQTKRGHRQLYTRVKIQDIRTA